MILYFRINLESMRNESLWKPSKFVYRNGKLKGSRDKKELAFTSRLVADITAMHYDNHLKLHAKGRLIDLGCGKVPLYEVYKKHISESTCADWATENSKNQFLDTTCDLNLPLPFESNKFNTIILSDVLEHIYKPDMLWKEMNRILAPGGKIILNTPFFYKLHETPHDYYRHTRFALMKHASENNLKITSLIEMGGLPEILGDLTSKACAYIPVIGTGLSLMAQWLCGTFIKTSFGQGISKKTSGQFPLGYFMVVEKP